MGPESIVLPELLVAALFFLPVLPVVSGSFVSFCFIIFWEGWGGALKMGGCCLVVISMDSLDSHM